MLVHGAWHGGWCWRRVADILEAKGHKVFTPTLTGVGERSHLLSGDINLDTHITDIVNVFEWEGIEDAVLCAHSYGGWVVSGAMELLRSKVSALVFVDAHMPADGESGVDTSNGSEEIKKARERGEISREAQSVEWLRVNEKDRAWVKSKMTRQPIGVSFQPIRLTGAREAVARKTYVRALDFPSEPFNESLRRARDSGWHIVDDIPGGHDLMIDSPVELAQSFLATASGILGARSA